MDEPTTEEAVQRGRALVLADLAADGLAGPDEVSRLEEAVSHRRWWAGEWPRGAVFVPGLLAQDMQDALLETHGPWPRCPYCADEPHPLDVEPELGEDPHWVCGRTGRAAAPVGSLASARR
ncbi:hypothetical protein [Streptomyces sp. RFCAC02]|uniref:hypothetical protein n=1 Tax=Streptomyces sp. RFCAC02 TaxID=2499143 RepID=UPI0010216933|nr:hypothetical protein [Streptomyces sp. RFCAC02]